MATPVTCCVITYNEEDNLGDCLESVSWADEIVVVDSHSTDGTVAIAREYTDRVIDHDFEGHVQQKNYAIDQAKNEWVLCVDADERVTPELKQEILDAMDNPGETAGYSMPRLSYYLGRFVRRGGWYPDRKLRLFRRDRGRWGGRNPHDRVEVDGPVKPFQGDLHHYSYKNIADHLDTINSFTRIAAEAMAGEGRHARLVDLIFRAPVKFLKMYVLKGGFLEGRVGLVMAVMSSYYVFLKYAKLWEIGRSER
ncbi:glycosyltransferase family 2 protein [Planctomycetota bacterium]